jgi:predicted TIM-barrel fold metal-dependent hydrolase
LAIGSPTGTIGRVWRENACYLGGSHMMTTFEGRAFDADGHYYEPHDAFTRHLEHKFVDRSLHVVPGQDGLGRLYFGDTKIGMMRVTQTDYTGTPGSRREFFQGLVDDGGWRQTDVINAHDYPPMMQKAARLALMDEQGIEATLLFPSVAVAVEHEMHDDPEAMLAGLRAFNRWLEEDWGFGADRRIYAAPMISLIDPAEAVLELRRVIELGARLVHVRRGPWYGQSPASPALDGFWGLCQETGIPVAFHVGDAGYREMWATAWGEDPRTPIQHASAFGTYLADTAAPDTFANLIFNNLFERFPRLSILSIENGSYWVPGLLKKLDKFAALGRAGTGLGGKFTAKASELFQRHFYVCPFFEEDPLDATEAIGVDHVLFGSDWPHPEGLAEPLEFAEKLVSRLPDTQVDRVMFDNIAELIGHPR